MKAQVILAALVVGGSVAVAGATSLDDAYAVARGGRLYDNWFAETDVARPGTPNPVYPDGARYKGDKGNDWRCKECHGWDYRGRDGAYGSGKHYTGTVGIGAAAGRPPEGLVAVLSDANHGYGGDMLSARDRRDLALFVSRGQVDMDAWIDRTSRRAEGDPERGRAVFQTVCATCHGLDGKGEETPPLGRLANENPWEVMHKVLNGQPKWEMPALRAFGPQVAADVVRYLQVELPVE